MKGRREVTGMGTQGSGWNWMVDLPYPRLTVTFLVPHVLLSSLPSLRFGSLVVHLTLRSVRDEKRRV